VPQSHVNGGGGGQSQADRERDRAPSVHWSRQLEYANISRQSTTPHHHARAVHLQQRGHTSAAVTITDPRASAAATGTRSLTATVSQHRKTDSGTGLPSSVGAGIVRPATAESGDAGLRTTAGAHRQRVESNEVIVDETTTVGLAGATSDDEGPDPDDQLWSTLDMGGMHLKVLGRELFRYTFLTALYVPHNQLTTLPAAVCQLTSLIRLDASGNKLSSVPPELGALTQLRDLFLFDNHLTSLPPELGTLHQLDVIGVAGNPLPETILSLVEKEGTAGLIAYLRDSCPVPLPPPDREWISVDASTSDFPSQAIAAATARGLGMDDASTDDDLLDADVLARAKDGPPAESFTVLTYNILCEKYATSHMYGYTPSWALAWSYRKEIILQEIIGYGADVICLQEVDVESYEEYFGPQLAEHEYEGVFYPKSRARTMSSDERRHVDGCATFYKRTVFGMVESELIEFNQVAMRRADFRKTQDMFNRVMTKDQISVVTLFEHRQSGMRLIVANAHVYWDPEFKDVKLVQVAMLMDELERVAVRFRKLPPKRDLGPGYDAAPVYLDSSKIPTIVCGDFNSEPGSGVYDFLTLGSIGRDHDDFMSHVYGNYTTEGLTHRLKLRSAYSAIGELPFTNYTPGFKGVIDYIWYSANALNVTNLLGPVDEDYINKQVVGFPNAHFPSDHLPILAAFRVAKK